MMKRWSFAVISFVLSLVGVSSALANPIEISLDGSYSRQNYDSDTFSWNRRWSASFGYTFLAMSEIEFSYQQIESQTVIGTFQNVKYKDQVYSVDLVQSLLPKSFFFQPFFRVGIGQMNRNAEGFFSNGTAPPAIFDSLTGVAGIGTRIFLSRRFAIRLQATSYIAGGDLNTWNQNIAFSAGISLIF